MHIASGTALRYLLYLPLLFMRGRQLNMQWSGMLSLDFSISFQCLLLLSLLTPLNTWALILGTPTPGTGFSAILTNGPATLTWTLEVGDPPLITFELQNNVTLDSFEFATKVLASSRSITRNMTDVPGSDHYFMQAVDISNITNVLAVSYIFTVAGAAPPTTKFPTPTPTPTSTAANRTAMHSTTFSSSVSQPPTGTSEPQAVALHTHTTPVGAIVGGVIGGLVFAALVAAFAFLYRRRRRRPVTVLSRTGDDDETRMTQNLTAPASFSSASTISPFSPTETPPLSARDAAGRLEQLRSEKVNMQRMRERLQSDMTGTGAERSDGVGQPDSITVSPTSAGDSDLRRQVELMSERIQQLEAQQQHLEVQQSLSQGLSMDQPPGYTSSPQSF